MSRRTLYLEVSPAHARAIIERGFDAPVPGHPDQRLLVCPLDVEPPGAPAEPPGARAEPHAILGIEIDEADLAAFRRGEDEPAPSAGIEYRIAVLEMYKLARAVRVVRSGAGGPAPGTSAAWTALFHDDAVVPALPQFTIEPQTVLAAERRPAGRIAAVLRRRGQEIRMGEAATAPGTENARLVLAWGQHPDRSTAERELGRMFLGLPRRAI
jgi:hypothetical protein